MSKMPVKQLEARRVERRVPIVDARIVYDDEPIAGYYIEYKRSDRLFFKWDSSLTEKRMTKAAALACANKVLSDGYIQYSFEKIVPVFVTPSEPHQGEGFQI